MVLLVQNGEIVTANQRLVADLWCEDESITRIGPHLTPPPGAEVIDATGKLVFPGFVDPHVHVYLPGDEGGVKDTYATASRAALLGGTTCFLDFCSPARDEDPRDALDRWHAASQGQSACDYGFHMAVTRFDATVAEALRTVVTREGIPSFKVYLAYRDALALNDAELLHTLALARELGALTLAHCENAEVIHWLQRRLLAAGRTGPENHHASRPPRVEAEGTFRLLAFAELLDVPVYIVHLSCGDALEVALAARRRGVTVHLEVLIAHLLLDRTRAEQPGFEGAKYVMSPPLRAREHQDALWHALGSGEIDTVATDHAPYDFATQKRRGEHDFTRIPNGLPGIQNRVDLLHTYGVLEGRMDLHRLVDAASTRPARLFGLYPKKGTIQVGSDADLVVHDRDYRGTISASTHAMNVDYNPYEDMAIRGRPHVVTVRGQVVVRDGVFVGSPGRGRFLAREPAETGVHDS